MNELENIIVNGSNAELDLYLELNSTDTIRSHILEAIGRKDNTAIKSAIELLNKFVVA